MFKISFLFQWMILCFLLPQSHSQENIIYSDWSLIREVKKEDFDLRIFRDGKVLFAQTTFKSPCIYTFDGVLKNDTIYYKTDLACMNIQTNVQEHKWTQLDTFVVVKKSEKLLNLFNIQNQKEIAFERLYSN